MLVAGEKITLRDYLYLHGMSINEFAEKIKCSRPYFSRLINGHTRPGKRLAQDIEDATNGEVKAEYLLKGE